MFSIKQVPRSENKKSDALSKIASTSFAHLSKQVLVEELKEKSINEIEVMTAVEEEGDTWMTPIFEYLTEEIQPAEANKARAVRRKSKRYGEKLTPITSPWPFHKLGIDIAGPFPEGRGKVKFFIVAIDYFTKWIEAKPVATITERANQSLGEGIKSRLDARSKDWVEEIPHVLRAHRTMIKSSNGDTLFALTYGTKAVILPEIGMLTLLTAEVNLAQNNEALEINLDLLEERREQEAIREAKSKAKMEKYYNSRVYSTSFKPGDLVYRSNKASHAEEGGKLGPKWEGQYEVTDALGKGAYKLKDLNGKPLLRTWNVRNLKRCYIYEMYFSFGIHLDELHVTWAYLEKKRTRLQTNTKTLEDLCLQSLETASQAIHDAVTTHQVTALHISRRRQPALTQTQI
ncbi:reverse transcriptase domain-containing protein [Tanacetum coccineum]